MDHDRLFKELLTNFSREFMELFLPDVAAYMLPMPVQILDKETDAVFSGSAVVVRQTAATKAQPISDRVSDHSAQPLALAGLHSQAQPGRQRLDDQNDDRTQRPSSREAGMPQNDGDIETLPGAVDADFDVHEFIPETHRRRVDCV